MTGGSVMWLSGVMRDFPIWFDLVSSFLFIVLMDSAGRRFLQGGSECGMWAWLVSPASNSQAWRPKPLNLDNDFRAFYTYLSRILLGSYSWYELRNTYTKMLQPHLVSKFEYLFEGPEWWNNQDTRLLSSRNWSCQQTGLKFECSEPSVDCMYFTWKTYRFREGLALKSERFSGRIWRTIEPSEKNLDTNSSP